MQTGIIDHWDEWFRPMPPQCLDKMKSVYKPQNSKTLKMKNHPPALSLKNLTGAFIVLLFGFSLSFLAFLCEQIFSVPYRHSRQLKKVQINYVNRRDKLTQEPAVNVEVEDDNQSMKINEEEPEIDTEDEFGNQYAEINEKESAVINTELFINIETKKQSTEITSKNLAVNCEEVEIDDVEH